MAWRNPKDDSLLCEFLIKDLQKCKKLEDCSCVDITTHSTDVKHLLRENWMNKNQIVSVGADGVVTSFSLGATFGPSTVRQTTVVFDTEKLMEKDPQFVRYVGDSTPCPEDETIHCAWEQEFFLKEEVPINEAREILGSAFSDKSYQDLKKLEDELEYYGINVPLHIFDCRSPEKPKTQKEAFEQMGFCQDELLDYLVRKYHCDLASKLRFLNKQCSMETEQRAMQMASALISDYAQRKMAKKDK